MHLLTHLFSTLFSFRLNMYTYLSTHLLVYVPTDPPEYKSTYSSWCYFLPANHEGILFYAQSMRMVISRSMTRKTQLPGSQMYLFINLPVHFDASIPNNRKDLPIHSPNVLHIIYLNVSMLTLQLTT